MNASFVPHVGQAESNGDHDKKERPPTRLFDQDGCCVRKLQEGTAEGEVDLGYFRSLLVGVSMLMGFGAGVIKLGQWLGPWGECVLD